MDPFLIPLTALAAACVASVWFEGDDSQADQKQSSPSWSKHHQLTFIKPNRTGFDLNQLPFPSITLVS